MRIDGILGAELDQQGFTLEKDQDFARLYRDKQLVATWFSLAATSDLIKQAALAWLKEHKRR